MATEILIAGGGYAGVRAAMALAKKSADIKITVVDKNSYHTLRTVLHEVAGNRLKPNSVTIPFKEIFRNKAVNVVNDQLMDYDFSNQIAKSAKNAYHYDYLIMGLGSVPNYLGIPGAVDYAFPLWNYHDAIKIRQQIRACFAKAQVSKKTEERRQLLTFAVLGSGATGIEMIGEIARWVKTLCKNYHIDRSEVRLLVVDRSKRILKTLNERNSHKAYKYLTEKLKVEIKLGVGVESVQEDGFYAGEQFISTQTLIWAAGIRASEQVEQLDIEKLQGRRLAVNAYGESSHKHVYVVGDLSGLADSEKKLYPAIAENAFYTGEGVANNILSDLAGKQQNAISVKSHGSIVCIGSHFAVAELGPITFPSWMATLMKGIVTIHYVWKITGLRGVKRYAFHEFFEAK